MQQRIRKVLKEVEIDLVHTQHLRMSQYTWNLDLPKILDLPDAYSLYWQRRKNTHRPLYLKLLDRVEIRRLVEAEKIIDKYDLCLVCSQEDKVYLEKLHSARNIRLLLNGVDLNSFDVRAGHNYALSNRLLFTGNMDYAPNVDAVQHFTLNILPEIVQKVPEVQFVIAGQRPVKAVRNLKSERVYITGFVEDLSTVYSESTLLVAPLRFGAGTQNKVLEAMAMGLPVICTKIGFAGLEIESGEGAVLCKSDSEFSEAVVRMLRNESLRQEVGQKGLSIARNKFNWDKISEQLEMYFYQLLNRNN
jgi:glycosyltransferase involved in cell wall biosynthesis